MPSSRDELEAINSKDQNICPHKAFICGDDIYYFKSYGTMGCLIDFSRGVLGREDIIDKHTSNFSSRLLLQDQRMKIMVALRHYFPEIFDEHMEMVNNMLLHNIEVIFRVVSAIDIYVLCHKLSVLANSYEQQTYSIFCGAISDRIKNHISSTLRAISTMKTATPDQIPWPNLLVIEEFFADHKKNDDRPKNICDYFDYGRPIKYDCTENDKKYSPAWDAEKYIQNTPVAANDNYQLRSTDSVGLNVNTMVWDDVRLHI